MNSLQFVCLSLPLLMYRMLSVDILFWNIATLSFSGFPPGVATPWGSFSFFLGSRELMIKIIIISSEFYLSYLEPLFAATKTIGTPDKTVSLLDHLKLCQKWLWTL